jgi:hypothetical protein
MSHCHDGHEHHGHDHSEGAAHDHTDDITPALQNHIYQQIDFSAINTLNESESGSGSKVVQKTWSERLDEEPELKSDADEQLLMHIPYVKAMDNRGVCVLYNIANAPQDSRPKSDSTAFSSALPPLHPHQ